MQLAVSALCLGAFQAPLTCPARPRTPAAQRASARLQQGYGGAPPPGGFGGGPPPGAYGAPPQQGGAPPPGAYGAPPQQGGLSAEKIESAKACAIAAVSGSLASTPLFVIDPMILTPTQYEFGFGMLIPELVLFGAVYRCTVRSDDSDPMKKGIVGAFALFRAFASLPMPTAVLPKDFPAADLFVTMGTSAIAFGCAAAAIEYAYKSGIVRPMAGNNPDLGLPRPASYGNGYESGGRGGGFGGFGGLGGFGGGGQQGLGGGGPQGLGTQGGASKRSISANFERAFKGLLGGVKGRGSPPGAGGGPYGGQQGGPYGGQQGGYGAAGQGQAPGQYAAQGQNGGYGGQPQGDPSAGRFYGRGDAFGQQSGMNAERAAHFADDQQGGYGGQPQHGGYGGQPQGGQPQGGYAAQAQRGGFGAQHQPPPGMPPPGMQQGSSTGASSYDDYLRSRNS